MKAINIIFSLIVVSMSLASCATQNILQRNKKDEANSLFEDSIFQSRAEYQYTLRKDDKISISVWDHDDLSVGSIYGIYNSNEVYGKWLLLDAAGNVNVPKLGTINLLGLTIIQAQEKLKIEYKKWVVNPIVEVKVLNREVTLLGELKTPGTYLLEKEKNSLLELIGRAGDLDFYANKKKVQIVRSVKNQPLSYTVDLTKMDPAFTANISLQPGDVVYVPSRKGKHWDKRAGSTLVPIASAISSIVLIAGLLK